MRRAVRISAAAALVLAGSSARANPPDTYGFGSREAALSGAAAAEVRGVSANYYNPAALARSRGLEVSVGYFRASHHLEMNGKDSHVEDVHGVVTGLVVPGRVWRVPFAFGVALHLPDDSLSKVRARRQETPRWELYDVRNQRLYFAANLAVEPFPWLQIGGGLSFMSATTARLDITGSANIFKSDDSQLRHEVDADLTAVRYPQAGVRVALSPRVALAAVYRGQFELDLDVKARLAGDISGLTTALYQLETQSINAFVPRQCVLGGSWELTRDLRAMLDVTWIEWSAYVAPAADLTTVLDVPPPAGGWPATIAPPAAPPKVALVPLRLHDRLVPHLGLEWQALHLRRHAGFVRGGYEVMRSPFDGQSGLTSYVDRDRHSFSLGLGYALTRPARELLGVLSLDAHAQLALVPTETTRKANPADFTGDFTAGGRFFSLGVTATFAFSPEGR
ncbi:MAG: outer membrane protein transport protein [Labilithrix sp.]